ncbi:MAG: CarD family transcriptional regulator [Clostridia bacterium]|nr:CarD family transcriptional regulator [Clostridia bacterium]
MYKVGDKIVYPMHGAGIVETIEDREVFGKTQSYYILRMPIGDLKIMIPTCADCLNGLRYVTDDISVDDFKEIFSSASVEDEPNWTKRSRDNLDKIRSGDLYEIISVVKGLLMRECIKPLSTGEKKILSLAKQIMFSELIVSLDVTQAELEDIIYTIVGRK